MTDLTSHVCPSPTLISARNKSERERLGISQRQAAAILGIHPSSYLQYEERKYYPRLPTLFALADGLGMDPRNLLPEWLAAVDRAKATA